MECPLYTRTERMALISGWHAANFFGNITIRIQGSRATQPYGLRFFLPLGLADCLKFIQLGKEQGKRLFINEASAHLPGFDISFHFLFPVADAPIDFDVGNIQGTVRATDRYSMAF